MNVQAPSKSSAKRKGKQISFFGENAGVIQPSPPLQRKNGMIRSEAEVSSGLVNPQPSMVSETPARVGQCQSVNSDLGMNQESGAATENTMPPNWAASILIDHLPKRSLNWKPPCSWTQNVAPFCASIGTMSIIDSNASGAFTHTLTKQGVTTQLPKQQLQQTQMQHQQQKPPQHQHLQQQNQLQHKQQQKQNQPQNQPQHQHQQQPNQSQHQHLQQQGQLQEHKQQQKQNQLQQPHHQQQNQPQHQQQNQTQPQNQAQLQNQPQRQQQHQAQPQNQRQTQQQNQLQHQLQQQHQQNQLQQQYQQHQLQHQLQHPLQHQQTQLLHQHQQQQSHEALPQHQFFQYSYGQSKKQELPPKAVLNVFHQPHQPPLLPLYSHQAQNMCQQHIFQQFFPHQQPPQSLGLRRVQMNQESESSMHQIVSTAAQFQQPTEAQVRKGLQRPVAEGHKQNPPSHQLVTEFQTPSAKQAQYSFKERKTKPSLFELQRLGNPSGPAENIRQHWPQAYGPELQKLLNVPPNHCMQNQLKLFEVDSLQSKSVQADEVDSWSQIEQEKIQLSQDSKSAPVPAQEAASQVEEAADGAMHSTARKGRTSDEINGLESEQVSTVPPSSWNSSTETLENDSQEEEIKRRTAGHLKVTVESAAPRGQLDDGCLMPLVIPVSVPVRKMDSVRTNTERTGDGESQKNSSEKDPSELNLPLLTTRRRRLSRGSGAEHSVQEDASSRGYVNTTAKLKRRPRPEPLFIPPKPLNHVSVITYPPGTLYQSNLRSPVRLMDHPLDKNFQPPPYTPPPILSPMREGSGLYFNAFLSSSNTSSQPVTPRSTPKTCLSQSNSADTPPPVLSLMNEATPASIEPRINIGPKFQAEIPELRDWSLAALDSNHADLVFKSWEGQKTNRLNQQRVDDLMTLACSSILPGGGTNQELVLHCLHESKGSVLAALNMLLIKRTPRGRGEALLSYHYAGSDKWTSTEKKMFNKGLAAHKKDFFLVQKLVKTKTVPQCVEFYYTYKKQVKIGRNGVLIFGDASDSNGKNEDEAVEIDRKDSLPRRARVPFVTEVKKEEDEDEEEEEEEEYSPDHKKLILTQAKVVKNEQNSAVHSQVVHLRKNPDPTYRCSYRPRQPAVATVAPRMPSRSEQAQSCAAAKHNKQSQENIFPCKKCGKVFSKVKSRSAHMKSHSVQEKKQREAELKSRVMAEEEQTEESEQYNDYSYCYQDV
ncbi:uncharacterized protein mideasb isoform X2 [Mustelus asterias]